MFLSLNARALGLDLPASATIDHAAAAGFGGVDLMVRDLVDRGECPRTLRHRLDDAGLRPGAWPLPVDWRTAAPDRLASDLKQLPRYAEAAAILGLERTGTWVLPAWPIAPDETPIASRSRADRFHRARLAPVATILAQAGIQLGLEVLGVATAREARGDAYLWRHGDPALAELVRDLNALVPATRPARPTVGLLADAFHLHAAGETAAVLSGWPREQLVWVHIADLPADFQGPLAAIRDEDRGLPGESGHVELREVFELLRTQGYDGPVTPEPLAGCRSLAGLEPGQRIRAVAAAVRGLV